MSKKRIIPLREEKHIRTKLALLNEIASGLKNYTFNQINIKQVCRSVLVSEPTFYNYFPRKRDVFLYYIRLWLIEIGWHMEHLADDLTFREVVDSVFDFYAEYFNKNPRLFNELTAALLREKQDEFDQELSFAEKYIAFPKKDGLVGLSAKTFENSMMAHIKEAKQRGELKNTLTNETLFIQIRSIIFSIPAQMRSLKEKKPLREYYKNQFDMLWNGIAK